MRHGRWTRSGPGMMGGDGAVGFHGMTCASCHGPDGRGGRLLAMGTVETPDIRYQTLIGAGEDSEAHADETDDQTTQEQADAHAHAPYTDPLILRAITQGLNPAGESLNPFMPRWSMAEEDLEQLIDFLKTL